MSRECSPGNLCYFLVTSRNFLGNFQVLSRYLPDTFWVSSWYFPDALWLLSGFFPQSFMFLSRYCQGIFYLFFGYVLCIFCVSLRFFQVSFNIHLFFLPTKQLQLVCLVCSCQALVNHEAIGITVVIDRPGVAGFVLQTPSSLIN